MRTAVFQRALASAAFWEGLEAAEPKGHPPVRVRARPPARAAGRRQVCARLAVWGGRAGAVLTRGCAYRSGKRGTLYARARTAARGSMQNVGAWSSSSRGANAASAASARAVFFVGFAVRLRRPTPLISSLFALYRSTSAKVAEMESILAVVSLGGGDGAPDGGAAAHAHAHAPARAASAGPAFWLSADGARA